MIPLLFMVVDKMNFSGACAGILFYGVSSQVCEWYCCHCVTTFKSTRGKINDCRHFLLIVLWVVGLLEVYCGLVGFCLVGFWRT